MGRNVLVFGEIRDNKTLRNASFEALAAAKALSEGGEIVGGIVGRNLSALAEILLHYGADRVIAAENEKLSFYTNDGYFQAYLQIIESVQPDVVLMGHTALGKDLSPRLATQLKAGLISDATEIEAREGDVIFTKPIFYGKAFEKKRVRNGIILATIRPHNILPLNRDPSQTGEITIK